MSGSVSRKLVTDGLIFYVDAANPKSFISGNTTWDDLGGNNNGTLTNGPTFDLDNGGSIVFDGSDDYIELGSIDSSNPLSLYGQTEFSVDLWLKPNYSGDDYQRVIDKSTGGSGLNGWCIAYPRNTSKFFYLFIDGGTALSYNDSSADGNWRNFTVTRNGSDTNLYINSELVATQTAAATIPIDTTNMRIATWNHTTGREYNGKIGNIKIYSKELLSTEVLQNYNALKKRFKLE